VEVEEEEDGKVAFTMMEVKENLHLALAKWQQERHHYGQQCSMAIMTK
jgi:hypothetical protein